MPADPAPQPQPKPTPVPEVRPVASAARLRLRHGAVVLSFFLMVVAPVLVSAWYLYTIAADQYHSSVGFTVRREETSPAVDILGGITSLSGGDSLDADILYEFIQSQRLVTEVDERLDLRRLYSKPGFDPVFAFDTDGPIEDLVSYWNQMVKISYDSSTRMIELRVLAFSPEDAQLIAEAIVDSSTQMINRLSAIARSDTTRYAGEELERAVGRLRDARGALTRFRNETQIVDPAADIQGQMGVLFSLQERLTEELIALDLLEDVTRQNDPRIDQARRRILVIEARIEEERRKFGLAGGNGKNAYADLIGQYEELTVDREFAQQAYVAALAAYDLSQAEARRQSRYLAAYVEPTLAESARYPQRGIMLGLVGLFLLVGWAIAVLVVYAVKDRR